jgi:hypothetical protein
VREHYERLADANANGAGVFFAVNELDGAGRRAENALALRALVADDDHGTVSDLFALQVEPSIVVATSAGKQHVYWLLKAGEPLAAFTSAQKALAAKLGTDPTVSDLARVLRLPGFLHQKAGTTPTLVTFDSWAAVPRYTVRDVLEGLGATVSDAGAVRVDVPTVATTPDGALDLTRVARAQDYIAKIFSIQGECGDAAAFKAACALVRNFALPRDVARDLLREWNMTNAIPPWDGTWKRSSRTLKGTGRSRWDPPTPTTSSVVPTR